MTGAAPVLIGDAGAPSGEKKIHYSHLIPAGDLLASHFTVAGIAAAPVIWDMRNRRYPALCLDVAAQDLPAATTEMKKIFAQAANPRAFNVETFDWADKKLVFVGGYPDQLHALFYALAAPSAGKSWSALPPARIERLRPATP
jgi:hypothetical protein